MGGEELRNYVEEFVQEKINKLTSKHNIILLKVDDEEDEEGGKLNVD
jgi:hypothetical protein